MKREKISESIGNINSRYIEEAANYENKARSAKKRLIKWGTLAACLLLAVCIGIGVLNSNNYIDAPVPFPEGPYVQQSGEDWHVYNKASDLIESADLVFVGKITGIDFQVLDNRTALPPSVDTPDIARQLYTVYNVEVITSYKGDTSNITNIRVSGGMVDYRVEEQLEIMERDKALGWEIGIPIWQSYKKTQCAIGEYCLFALCRFETGAPTILNPWQSIYKLDDPSKKQGIGSKDNYSSMLSAKDIIKEFGFGKWIAFYTQWKNGAYKLAVN